jgi:hypothetical protein
LLHGLVIKTQIATRKPSGPRPPASRSGGAHAVRYDRNSEERGALGFRVGGCNGQGTPDVIVVGP